MYIVTLPKIYYVESAKLKRNLLPEPFKLCSSAIYTWIANKIFEQYFFLNINVINLKNTTNNYKN